MRASVPLASTLTAVAIPLFLSCATAFSPRVIKSSSTGARFVLQTWRLGAVADEDSDETRRASLKSSLLDLAASTDRGFRAIKSDRKEAELIIEELSNLNPTAEPAAAYYGADGTTNGESPTIAGKWTLVYTDAPDIIGLDTTGNGGPLNFLRPPTTADLGRIGQECDPPSIKNVIEWLRPEWADKLPFGGDGAEGSSRRRILQKVCVTGKSTPDDPTVVDLDIVGLDLLGEGGGGDGGNGGLADLLDPSTLLNRFPLELRGPRTVPFGKFRLLYLDDELRIIRTGQNYIAVNIRAEGVDAWF